MTFPPQTWAQPQAPAQQQQQQQQQQYAQAPAQQQYAAPAAPQQPQAPAGPQNWGQPQAAPQHAATPTSYQTAPGAGFRPYKNDLKGRLILATPTAMTQGKNKTTGLPYPAVVCDVIVLDGGPVISTNPQTPGLTYDGHEFSGVWLEGTFLNTQLSGSVGTGQTFLGRLDTKTGAAPGPGNPWGLNDPTPQDRALADRYLSGDRTFVVATGTVPPPAQQTPRAPVQQQPQAAPPQNWGQPQQPQAQQYAPQPQAQQYAPPAAPQPQYAQQPQAAPGPWAPGGNPFGG